MVNRHRTKTGTVDMGTDLRMLTTKSGFSAICGGFFQLNVG